MSCNNCQLWGTAPEADCPHETDESKVWKSNEANFAFSCEHKHVTEQRLDKAVGSQTPYITCPVCATLATPLLSTSFPVYNMGGVYGNIPTSEAHNSGMV